MNNAMNYNWKWVKPNALARNRTIVCLMDIFICDTNLCNSVFLWKWNFNNLLPPIGQTIFSFFILIGNWQLIHIIWYVMIWLFSKFMYSFDLHFSYKHFIHHLFFSIQLFQFLSLVKIMSINFPNFDVPFLSFQKKKKKNLCNKLFQKIVTPYPLLKHLHVTEL